MCIASSGVLVRLSDSTPVTVAVYRCLFALPILGLLTYLESRRLGPLPGRSLKLAWAAGIFFALDLIFWHHSIAAVGAGLATVLGNLQVLVVGFAAWAILSEKPQKTLFIAVPVILSGVVLISGVIGSDAYGENPGLGVVLGIATSLAYAAFLLTLREGSRDLRRIAGPLFHATWVAAVACAIYGAIDGSMQWNPGWPAFGWLLTLALTSQVAGWLLISSSLPRLPAAVTSVILLLQPVGAMTLAAVTLDERPGLAQLAGAVLILVGVVVATSGHRKATAPASPNDPAPEGALSSS
jgi:drug/metabolite transporter (DMT)-like permease